LKDKIYIKGSMGKRSRANPAAKVRTINKVIKD